MHWPAATAVYFSRSSARYCWAWFAIVVRLFIILDIAPPSLYSVLWSCLSVSALCIAPLRPFSLSEIATLRRAWHQPRPRLAFGVVPVRRDGRSAGARLARPAIISARLSRLCAAPRAAISRYVVPAQRDCVSAGSARSPRNNGHRRAERRRADGTGRAAAEATGAAP